MNRRYNLYYLVCNPLSVSFVNFYLSYIGNWVWFSGGFSILVKNRTFFTYQPIYLYMYSTHSLFIDWHHVSKCKMYVDIISSLLAMHSYDSEEIEGDRRKHLRYFQHVCVLSFRSGGSYYRIFDDKHAKCSILKISFYIKLECGL